MPPVPYASFPSLPCPSHTPQPCFPFQSLRFSLHSPFHFLHIPFSLVSQPLRALPLHFIPFYILTHAYHPMEPSFRLLLSSMLNPSHILPSQSSLSHSLLPLLCPPPFHLPQISTCPPMPYASFGPIPYPSHILQLASLPSLLSPCLLFSSPSPHFHIPPISLVLPHIPALPSPALRRPSPLQWSRLMWGV